MQSHARVLVLALALALPGLAHALPTPGANGAATEPLYGRLFPEPLETNDYISYDEAVASFALLSERYPDLLEVVVIGESVGWPATPGGAREPRDVLAVEVTNEKSAVPADKKLTTVFFLSIHGNEKGGREGGFRAIEDLVAGLGIAEEDPELTAMLDYQKLVFIFANTDGWTHEELKYRHADACYVSLTCGTMNGPGETGVESQNFVRVNGNGTDLNRQFPTVGYMAAEYRTLAEPEARGMATYAKSLKNVVAGADIHGMLNHDYYYLMMLKDGQRTQQELFENERLAELLKERINSNPYYAAWQSLPHVNDVGGGQFAEWSSTIDAIGYSAQGTAGAFIVQEIGLNAPGFTVEMAYNHIAVDDYYPGAGAVFNDYHVRAVRDTVITFMRFAAERVDLSVETQGQRVAVLTTPMAATSLDDDPTTYQGWMAETTLDDAFDISHVPFSASPNDYWKDLARFVRAGDAPAVLDLIEDPGQLAASLGSYDVVVIPGSAASRAWAPADVEALKAWVESGKRLVLTDDALQMLATLGVVEADAVKRELFYSGYSDLLTRDHAFTSNLRGDPRQTYDPNPLGFAPDQSPGWFVTADAWEATGGTAIGVVGLARSGCDGVQVADACVPAARAPEGVAGALGAATLPRAAPREAAATSHASYLGVNLGVVPLGDGEVRIFGAILPDPKEDAYHPYGLEGYAVSAAGNLILLNMLGFEYVYAGVPAVDASGEPVPLANRDAPSAASQDATEEPASRIPAPGAAVALAAAAAVAAGLARRRRS